MSGRVWSVHSVWPCVEKREGRTRRVKGRRKSLSKPNSWKAAGRREAQPLGWKGLG